MGWDLDKAERMGVLQNVVVGLDGSEDSAAALNWLVARIPDDATMHLIHAFSPSTELTLAATQTDWYPRRQQAERDLADIWSSAADDSSAICLREVADDEPANALLRKAAAVGATLIVVGAHGYRRTSPPVGRVTRKLLRESPVPIIVVRAGFDPPENPFVLAGVGYGSSSDAASEWAAQYAGMVELPLELMHVVSRRPIFPIDSPTDMLASYFGGSLPDEWAESELEGRMEDLRLKSPDVFMRTRVVRGGAIDELTNRGVHADLVVIGRGHADSITRNVLGSKTKKLLTHATGATAIVPA
jgi:nucleotide-binding universal stress UspA family protein